jgi:ATP-binding cassette subfamily C protein CydC
VLQRLSAKAARRTLLIATHIRREAEIADRLIAMKEGRIIDQASRADAQFEVLLASLRQD